MIEYNLGQSVAKANSFRGHTMTGAIAQQITLKPNFGYYGCSVLVKRILLLKMIKIRFQVAKSLSLHLIYKKKTYHSWVHAVVVGP